MNKSNLPNVLYRVLSNLMQRDDYTKGAAHLSVTELINSPRIRVLRQTHDADIERDAADSLWQLVGRAIHKVVEGGVDDGHIAEQRLFTTVNGVRISGALDLQDVDGAYVDISDWKFTSVWSLRQDKSDWHRQLNMYAYLARKNGKLVRKLSVNAVLRDWSRAEAKRDPSYPQAPIAVLDIPIAREDVVEKWVEQMVDDHLNAQVAHDMGEPLPLCTSEERWTRPDRFAVMKHGAKRATAVFDMESEAVADAHNRGQLYIVEKRAGEPVRCTGNYCGVSQWCDQYQKELKESSSE